MMRLHPPTPSRWSPLVEKDFWLLQERTQEELAAKVSPLENSFRRT